MSSEATFNVIEGDTTNAGDNNSAIISSRWHLCGTNCPKSERVYLCQVFVLYTVIVVSIYNLTFGRTDCNLWTALLSSSLPVAQSFFSQKERCCLTFTWFFPVTRLCTYTPTTR